MIRTLYAYFFIGLSLLLSIIPYLVLLLLKLLTPVSFQKSYTHTLAKLWGKWMVALSSTKVTVTGLEKLPSSNALFVANHQSYYDIPLFLGYINRPVGFVAKIEMAKAPLISVWMKELGCLFLDRGNLKQSLKVILQGIEQLKAGDSLVIFPEGTRSKTGQVAEFKKGSLKLGTKAGVPIVPVTIDSSGPMYEFPGYRVTKCQTRIIIHDAIYINDLSAEDEKNLAEIVHDIISKPLDGKIYQIK